MALDGFGNRLKAIRQERGYTQKQLADLLGVTEQAVSKYERGNSYPDISMLDGISLVLDCSLDYLFQFKSGKKSWLSQDSIEQKSKINQYLLPDIISLQFGEAFVPLFLEENRQGFPHIHNLRQQIAKQWGIIIPVIRLMDQLAFADNEYHICINNVSVYKNTLEHMDNETILHLLGKLKETIFHNIAHILNNQSIYFMVENLRQKYPYVVEGIVPELISYSKLRQVLICLLQNGYTVNPLILIIETIEQYLHIINPKEFVEIVAKELGEAFQLEHWVK